MDHESLDAKRNGLSTCDVRYLGCMVPDEGRLAVAISSFRLSARRCQADGSRRGHVVLGSCRGVSPAPGQPAWRPARPARAPPSPSSPVPAATGPGHRPACPCSPHHPARAAGQPGEVPRLLHQQPADTRPRPRSPGLGLRGADRRGRDGRARLYPPGKSPTPVGTGHPEVQAASDSACQGCVYTTVCTFVPGAGQQLGFAMLPCDPRPKGELVTWLSGLAQGQQNPRSATSSPSRYPATTRQTAWCCTTTGRPRGHGVRGDVYLGRRPTFLLYRHPQRFRQTTGLAHELRPRVRPVSPRTRRRGPQPPLGPGAPHHRKLVVETGVGAEVVQRTARSRLGIGCRKNQPAQARRHQGPSAHGARLQRHVEGRIDQPPGADGPGRLTYSQNLGVRRGVAGSLPGVGAPADDFAFLHDHRAHRYLAIGAGSERQDRAPSA